MRITSKQSLQRAFNLRKINSFLEFNHIYTLGLWYRLNKRRFGGAL